MIKDVIIQNSKKILVLSLIFSVFFNILQIKKSNSLQKEFQMCKDENFSNQSTINELENDKQELENEKEELDDELEECKRNKIYSFNQ